MLCTQLTREPGPRQLPVSQNCLRRDVECLRGFFDAQPSEESQFDDVRSTGVDVGQTREGLVEQDELEGPVGLFRWKFVEVQARVLVLDDDPATPLRGGPPTCMIDQNATYDSCTNGEEVHAVLPLGVLHADKAQVRLVDQGCGLERMPASFPAQVATGQSLELAVHEGRQPVERGTVAAAPGLQEDSNIAGTSVHAVDRADCSCRRRFALAPIGSNSLRGIGREGIGSYAGRWAPVG